MPKLGKSKSKPKNRVPFQEDTSEGIWFCACKKIFGSRRTAFDHWAKTGHSPFFIKTNKEVFNPSRR